MKIGRRSFLGGSLTGAGAVMAKAAGLEAGDVQKAGFDVYDKGAKVMTDNKLLHVDPVPHYMEKIAEAVKTKAERAAFGRIPTSVANNIRHSNTHNDQWMEVIEMKSLSRAGAKWIAENRLIRKAEKAWFDEPDRIIEQMRTRIEESKIAHILNLHW